MLRENAQMRQMTLTHSAPMLQAVEVSFAYGDRGAGIRPVLDDVSVTIEPGTVVGLLGPNGSGKTTLLRALSGMIEPRQGKVLVGGTALASLSRRALARRIAVVPQDTHTAFDFSVLDMVLMGRYPHLGPFAVEGPEDLRLAREALAATGTAAFESRPFSTLSGGERQRVVIAGALAQASDALLLDEPTASLDLGYQLEIGALLSRINRDRGTTIVVSTHDLNLAAAICGRIIMLKAGRVIAQGATTDTLTAENLRALYDVRADVRFHDDAGHLTVVPLARVP